MTGLKAGIQIRPPGSYARVVSYIDKESGGLIVAEAFDRQNKSLKEFSVRQREKGAGRVATGPDGDD